MSLERQPDVSPGIHRPQWRPAGIYALIIAALLMGCGAPPARVGSLDAAVTFTQEAVAELPRPPAYRIGLNTEVTGTGAQIGDMSVRAARLAVEEINAAGGVNGVPIELVVRDCRSDVTTALAQYRAAVAGDDLVALIGPLKSAYAVALVPEHRGSTLPMLIGATNTTLTEQGDQNLFRMRPSDRLTAAAMVALAVEQLGRQRIGVIHDSDAFGSGGAERVQAELEGRGLAPVVKTSYATGTKDFDQLVRQVAAAGVDALLIYGTNSTDVGSLLRTIHYWSLDATIITSPGGASVVTHNVAADAQDGIYVAVDAVLDSSPSGATFEAAFRQRFGMPPDTYVAWIYDALHMIAAALRQPGSASPAGLGATIRDMGYEGAQGRYRFDAAGEGLQQVSLVQMRQGKAHLVGCYSADGLVLAPDAAERKGPREAGAAGRAGERRAEELVELHLAIRLLHRDDGVAELDEVFALHAQQLRAQILRRLLAGKADDHQICHVVSPHAANRAVGPIKARIGLPADGRRAPNRAERRFRHRPRLAHRTGCR
jgi:branched-chain amino acid transport system substrate-binding protein